MSIKILQGKAVLQQSSYTTFRWRNVDSKSCELQFAQAFQIMHKNWDEGLEKCIYQVREKQFKDLSFVKGVPLKTFAENQYSGFKFELRKYRDDKKNFLFQCEDVPTFDSGDREWDSSKVSVIYFDEVVTAITCNYGYKIPRISVYFDLLKADGSFIKWLIYIGCGSKNFPDILN